LTKTDHIWLKSSQLLLTIISEVVLLVRSMKIRSYYYWSGLYTQVVILYNTVLYT